MIVERILKMAKTPLFCWGVGCVRSIVTIFLFTFLLIEFSISLLARSRATTLLSIHLDTIFLSSPLNL